MRTPLVLAALALAGCGETAATPSGTLSHEHATVDFAGAVVGAFSPDGRRLAVRDEGGRIAVVDLASRAVRDVAGAPADYPLLAWASSGWLFYAVGTDRVGAWRPGGPARTLPIDGGAFIDMTSD